MSMTQTQNSQTDRMRGAYTDNLPHATGGWVSLAALREDSGLTALQFEATVRSMIHDDDVMIVPASNQRELTAGELAGTVVIGNQAKHWMKID